MGQSDRPTGKASMVGVVAILAVLVVLAGVGWYLGRQTEDGNGESTVADAYSQKDLDRAVEAVAAAEDLQFEQAVELWQQLVEKYPDLVAFQINEAVTVLKWIDVTNNALNSGTIQDAQQREELESALDEAYGRAGQVIEKLALVQSADPQRIALLRAALLEAQARRLPGPEEEQVRRQAAQVVQAALTENPAQPALAAKFDEIILPLDVPAEDELAQQNAEFLYAAWQASPRNLYLLSRAADALLKQQDPRLAELLEPSVQLSESMRAEVARDMRSLKIDSFIPQVREAIEAGEWRKAFRVKSWLNVIKGMSGFRSDLRLVKPDVLALLDTEFLEDFSEKVRDNQPASPVRSIDGISLASEPWQRDGLAVAWFDYDLDLDFDLVVLDDQQLALYALAEGTLAREAAQELALPGNFTGCLVAEFFAVDDTRRNRKAQAVDELMEAASSDPLQSAEPLADEPLSEDQIRQSKRHDTYQELLLWGADGIRFVQVQAPATTADSEVQAGAAVQVAAGELKLVLLEAITDLEDFREVVEVAALDIESDGDLDLLIATQQGLHVLQNNGNRTFKEITEFSDLSQAPANIQSIVIGDVDGDLDQDALLVSPAAKHVVLLENILHNQFRARVLQDPWPTVQQPSALAMGDFDGNGSWDFAVAEEAGTRVVLTRTPEPGTWVPMTDSGLDWQSQALSVGDMNNDGLSDLVLGGTAGLAVHYGEAGGKFSPAVSIPNAESEVAQVAIMDANGDGVLEVGMIDGGQARVLWGEPKRTNYLAIRLRGINDVNGGGRINHYCVGSVLEVWSAGRRQRQVVRQPVTHFGLGSGQAQNIRVVFNNGLTQNVEQPEVNTLVEEKQELKGSCPFIYGWDGQKFVLITDALWNAPLGLQIARGEVLPDRRWENLWLPGERVQPRDGAYELRFTEELWEVAYVDHMQLTAIDHPQEVRVFTNEKVGPPTIAEHRVYGFAEPLYPAAALDRAGRNVLPSLLRLDHDYVTPFERIIHQGLVEPHYIELRFDELPLDQELYLCLSGWMYPTDTSLNIGISQDPDRRLPEPPSLWSVDEQGVWQCVEPFMGFPGGKPKSIVIPLKDAFLSDDLRLRVASSQQIYWDEMFVAVDTPEDLIERPLNLQAAELRYRGFSQLLPRAADQPHWYDYTQCSERPKWPALEGPFTRFGDVRALLVADDDRMVVMTSGDEIAIRFSVPSEALPQGWQRDFVLHSTGWDKDADLNTLAGQGSLPLPFAAQTQYPPGPKQSEQAAAVWQLNADTTTRGRLAVPAEQSLPDAL